MRCRRNLPHALPLALPPQVFDGHNGPHAAHFAAAHILDAISGSRHFPGDVGAAMADAFLSIDRQYQAAVHRQPDESAGTTALAAVLFGGTLWLANAGDRWGAASGAGQQAPGGGRCCRPRFADRRAPPPPARHARSRAVLSRGGRAVQLTRDHKPAEPGEARRIASSGGYVCGQGLLCGELGVARAIGDWNLAELKAGPLTAEPEVSKTVLLADDELLLLGCDGLWDVFSSQRAVEYARAR